LYNHGNIVKLLGITVLQYTQNKPMRKISYQVEHLKLCTVKILFPVLVFLFHQGISAGE